MIPSSDFKFTSGDAVSRARSDTNTSLQQIAPDSVVRLWALRSFFQVAIGWPSVATNGWETKSSALQGRSFCLVDVCIISSHIKCVFLFNTCCKSLENIIRSVQNQAPPRHLSRLLVGFVLTAEVGPALRSAVARSPQRRNTENPHEGVVDL